MKYRTIISLFVLLAVLLSACKPAATTATQVGTDYPAPAAAYPDAQSSAPLSVLYPDPQSGDEVSWQAAVAMINNGEVTQVVQTQDLKLTLSLRDGRSLFATQAAFDDIKAVIEKCGDPCKDIKLVNQ